LPTPAVILHSDARARLKRGFDALAHLLARTIGPTQGHILSAGSPSTGPELLVDAATIARRFLALPDRCEDVGAMLARNLVWQVHQTVGDGCATAAVLAQAMIAQAHRHSESGADVVDLCRGIAAAANAAVETLQRMARPVIGERDLLQIARTATGEPRISALLAEIYDLLGPDAYVGVEEYLAPYLEREYLPGGQWKAFLASPYLISSPDQRSAVLQNGAVALFAGEICDLDDIRPLLDILASTERRRLLLVANKISGAALATLVLNHQREQIQVVAATLRRPGEYNQQDFADLAMLTGARLLAPEIGDRIRAITPAALGTVQFVKATTDMLIVSDRRDNPSLREHITALRQQLACAVDSEDERAALRQRIGRLSGSVATLKIGAQTRSEAAVLRQKAEQGIHALVGATRDGVVLGGGVAYLNCISALEQLRLTGDAAQGAAVVAQALEAPFRWIVANAGVRTPNVVLAEARRCGPRYGYEATSDAVVDMEMAGILDAAGVVSGALRAAASATTMVLTTNVVVLKRHPELSMEP
jgi:chaperonin GroEL